MDGIAEWITPAIVVSVSGLFWRHLVRIESRFDRVEDRLDLLARDVAANGRAIARLGGLHEVHPVAAAE